MIHQSPLYFVQCTVNQILWKEPTRCNHVVEFIIPVFLNCSTCFGRHTAHHQELKNCNCSLWFYISFWLPAAAMAEWELVQVFSVVVLIRKSRDVCTHITWLPDQYHHTKYLNQFPLGHRSGRQPKTYVKAEAAITVFELLMMGGVSPETCWAIKKH